jgi:hypothetical protein
MTQSIVIIAALRDLLLYVPILVIIAALYSVGIRIRVPGSRSRFYGDDDEE